MAKPGAVGSRRSHQVNGSYSATKATLPSARAMPILENGRRVGVGNGLSHHRDFGDAHFDWVEPAHSMSASRRSGREASMTEMGRKVVVGRTRMVLY